MDIFLNTLIKEHSQLHKAVIHFGNNKNIHNEEHVMDCSISDSIVQKIMSKFMNYPHIKRDFNHIVALDKELFIQKENNTCIRKYTVSSKIISIPETNLPVCLMTQKIEKLKEIDFPSSNKYQKYIKCIEYIFTIHDKIKLIIHSENKNTTVFMDITIDDYIDTTVQYLKDGIIEQISKMIQ